MKLQLLLTGNELMSGDTIDSNSAAVAAALTPLGIGIERKVTLGDSLQQLVEELDNMASQCQVLLVNGGLGPTQDDLTAQALAALTDSPLEEHPAALEHLRHWCAGRSLRLNSANLKQALLPACAQIIPNPVGSAVGIRVSHKGCEIFCTPGVPSELRAMLRESIIPELEQRVDPAQTCRIERLHTYGLGESTLQQWIQDELPDWPAGVELGFRAGAPTLEVKLKAPLALRDEQQQARQQLERLIGDYIVAEADGTLARSLIALLTRQKRTLALAESCTGGLIASLLTAEAGASGVFEAGYVTYSNRIKERLLSVDAGDLARHGAVSETVARQMASGALAASGADYVIAVTGIAGPDGGSPEKPVGTVWLAWGGPEELRTACLYFPYGRRLFQTMTAGAGLDLLRRFAAGIETPPRYIRDRQPPASTDA